MDPLKIEEMLESFDNELKEKDQNDPWLVYISDKGKNSCFILLYCLRLPPPTPKGSGGGGRVCLNFTGCHTFSTGNPGKHPGFTLYHIKFSKNGKPYFLFL